MAIIACENLAPYLDGDPTDATTPADEQAACLDPIPPTGPLSIESLATALGDKDTVLELADTVELDLLDHNRISQDCTYQAVIVQQTMPASGCTLLLVTFVDDEATVSLDVPAGLATIESGGVGDFLCRTEGSELGEDNDCDDALDDNGDGVVVFHVLNESSTDGNSEEANVSQESVEQTGLIQVSSDTRYDPRATNTPEPKVTDTPEPTATNTPEPTATKTPIPTATPTPDIEITSTPPLTLTPVAARTAVATGTAAATRTAGPARTVAPSRTVTPTRTPSLRRCADVTGDGKVTWKDVGKIAKAIAKRSHNPRYDVDSNSRVGFADLVFALKQLGRRCER